MEWSERQALERTSRHLATGILMTDHLLATFVQDGVLDLDLMELVQAEKTNTEKVIKLLHLLPRRKPGTFDTFLSILKEDYSWLADKLREEHDTIVTEEEKRKQALHSQPRDKKPTGGAPQDSAYATSLADIRKLVGVRIHKMFGQSRKISEKEKHGLERWLSHEIWRQRCQAVAELEAHSPVPDMSRERSTLSQMDHDLDAKTGMAPATQKQVFPIYLRLEGAGLSEGREQLMPQDMTWELMDKMIVEMLERVGSLEEERDSCLDYFRTAGLLGPSEPASLSQLVKGLVQTQERSRADGKRIQTKLDRQERELDACAEHIKKLEDERSRLRTENKRQTADLVQLRSTNDQLVTRCQELEQMKKLTLEREYTIDKLKQRVSQLEKGVNDPVARKRWLTPLQQASENRWSSTANSNRARENSPERMKKTFRSRRKVVKKKNNAP